MCSTPPRIIEVAYGSAEYTSTVALRQRWLRDPLGLRFTEQELAAERDSHHLACFVGEELVGCAVLRPLAAGRMQMRQLIVRPDFERRGVGTALVEASEALARRRGSTRMVLHARLAAVGFYERLGYRGEGERFIHVGIPHWKMAKNLSGGDPHRSGG